MEFCVHEHIVTYILGGEMAASRYMNYWLQNYQYNSMHTWMTSFSIANGFLIGVKVSLITVHVKAYPSSAGCSSHAYFFLDDFACFSLFLLGFPLFPSWFWSRNQTGLAVPEMFLGMSCIADQYWTAWVQWQTRGPVAIRPYADIWRQLYNLTIAD